MGIYAQHGYGKSDKIVRALGRQLVSGVIMSPKDESPERLKQTISELEQDFPTAQILFDPQFYVTTITPCKPGHLVNYDYYEGGLTRASFIRPSSITGYVHRTLDFQRELGLTRFISPTIVFNDFRENWSQIALMLAEESATYCQQLGNQLLVSIVVSEAALRSREGLNEFLDMITMLDVSGFYVIVKRDSPSYQAMMDPNVLENLMYLTYVLHTVNGFEVIVGYCDLVGIPLHAVGVTATANGWFTGLRQFTLNRFMPSTGGRAARPRYTAAPLLNSILVVPELEAIAEFGFVDRVLTQTAYDVVLRTNPSDDLWPNSVSCLHHWETLNKLASDVSGAGNNSADRLTSLLDRIDLAEALYKTMTGVPFEYYSGSGHLNQWRVAIKAFLNSIGG